MYVYVQMFPVCINYIHVLWTTSHAWNNSAIAYGKQCFTPAYAEYNIFTPADTLTENTAVESHDRVSNLQHKKEK